MDMYKTSVAYSVLLLSMALFLIVPQAPAMLDPLANMEIGEDLPGSVEKEKTWFIGFNGYYESRNQGSLDLGGEWFSLRQRLWTESLMGHRPIKGFASVYFDWDPAIGHWREDDLSLYRLKLHEGYVTLDNERFDLSLGQKMVRWGAADGVATMDLINPLDARDPFGNARADTRLPVPLVQAVFTFPGLIWEAVLIPEAQVNELPPAGSPWEPADLSALRKAADMGVIDLGAPDKPDGFLAHPEFGLRALAVCRGYDIALLFFNGYENRPVFERSFSTDGRIGFSPRYDPFQAYGLNFAKGLRQGTIRGELAYKTGLRFHLAPEAPGYAADRDGLTERNVWQAVLGIDYTFLTSLYLNLQVFVDRIEDGRETLADGLTAHGITFQVHEKFLDDDLEAGIRGIGYTHDRSWAAELFADYLIGDRVTLSPGVTLFGANADTVLGQSRGNDMISLRVRISF
jgi:hypothetical protein